MLSDFFMLGLEPDADDQSIRRHYLERVKRFTPEADPLRFQEITAAYERIKTRRNRIATAMFGPLDITDSEQALLALAGACARRRRRAGLAELLNDLTAGAASHRHRP